MCQGPILKKILIFSIPLMLSGILQLLFNAADIIVVGRFVGSDAMVAVGATGSLISLIVNLFMGLSVGTSVVIAQYYGSHDYDRLSKAVHTSVAISLICGIFIGIFGFITSRSLLVWMKTPADVIDHSVLYMKIYFAGAPFSLLYNFGAAVLRAVGDTRRPLYFLTLAGVLNVILNIILVIAFNLSVAGVAIATVVSQGLSAILVVLCLIKSDGCCHLNIRELKIYKNELIKIIKIGVPAGIQSSLFAISNVLIQSSVNSFGKIAVAGNTAASNLEGFVYISMNTFHQTSMTFCGAEPRRKKI